MPHSVLLLMCEEEEEEEEGGECADIRANSLALVQVEHHTVMTDDGYILGIHRIRNRFVSSCPEPAADTGPASSGSTNNLQQLHDASLHSNSNQSRRPVVLLMHGLMQDSECFMVDSRERGLAFWCVE
jgi:hypothetical protein